MTSTGRINYIDELKGFILCLVCLGHIAYSELSYAMNWMSLMRMFTFFFLSGLLFSRRRFPTFKDYAISKTKHLLFPYIWLSLFFLIITFQIYSGNIDEASRGPLFIKIENILSLVGITSNFICSLCANFFKIFNWEILLYGQLHYGLFLLYGLLVYYMLLLTNAAKTKYH